MPRVAPYAAEIAALRPRLAEAQRARIDLARLAGCADLQRLDAPAPHDPELMRSVASTWAELDVQTVAQLRAALSERTTHADALQARLAALRDAQHDALHDPAWAEVVDAVRRLIEEREALAPTLRANDRRARHLAAAATALRDAASRIDAAPARTSPALSEATASGLRDLLAALDLGELHHHDLLGAGALRDGAAVLDAAAHQLHGPLAAQRARLNDLERQLDEVLG